MFDEIAKGIADILEEHFIVVVVTRPISHFFNMFKTHDSVYPNSSLAFYHSGYVIMYNLYNPVEGPLIDPIGLGPIYVKLHEPDSIDRIKDWAKKEKEECLKK